MGKIIKGKQTFSYHNQITPFIFGNVLYLKSKKLHDKALLSKGSITMKKNYALLDMIH